MPQDTARFVAARQGRIRSLASELAGLLSSWSLAGLSLGLLDVLRLALRQELGHDLLAVAAVIGLWEWTALSLGLLTCAAFALWSMLKPRTRVATRRRLLVVAATAVCVPFALKICSGTGIRRTPLGVWGPFLLPLALGLATWLWQRAGERLRLRQPANRFRIAAAGCLAAASALLLLLESSLTGGYLYIHVFLLLLALGAGAAFIWFLHLSAWSRYAGGLAALLTLPAVVTFPASAPARALLVNDGWAGLQLVDYAQFKVDFDGDHHSPVFGGADCNDKDPHIYYGAPETAGDGVDSNCDGQDDPPRIDLPFAPFVASDAFARSVSAVARHFPTVVVLVDALRFDRVDAPQFPILSELARESIRFTRVYSTSSTTVTSVPAIMSGQVRPESNAATVVTSLSALGQRCDFVSMDQIVEIFRRLAFQPLRGFASVAGITTDYATYLGDSIPTTRSISRRATDLLDSARPPDLLWLHYFDVHQWARLNFPNLPPSDSARYDAVVKHFESGLSQLLARRDSVNIVLLADHGEGLGAHHVMHHGWWAFAEETRIPLLVRVPGVSPRVVNVPVSTTGVANLLRDLRGVARDPNAGESLLDLVGAKNVGAGPGFASFEVNQSSLIYGDYRLLYTSPFKVPRV